MDNIKIVVASDSISETTELVVRVGVSQFNPKQCKREFLRYPYIESSENVDEVIQIAKDTNVIIVYVLVKLKIKKYMISKVNEHALKSVDIMGPPMELLSNSIEEIPYHESGMAHRLDDAYSEEVDAIEFAVKYDDGKDPKGLSKADIVLLGISRTSKIPLSQYLVHKSYRVMDVPIVPEVTPSDGLFNVDPSKCTVLKISEEKLNRTRKERLKQLGLGDKVRYATEARIQEESDYFEKLVDKIGYPVIDASDKVIEKTADDITHFIE